MKVYRVTKSPHVHDLSGIGSRIYGGRWNQKGTSIIYTSESRALATVEFLVHVPISIVPINISIVTIEIPDRIIPREISKSDLPTNWRDYPVPSELADIGTNWALSNETLLLRVPSIVIEHEFNMLINPSHSEMKHVVVSNIEKYKIDERLLRRK